MSDSLRALRADLPVPRSGLSESEKDDLVKRVGPRTARAIVRAKAELPLARIPFLFSSIDTQAVVDLLANDMADAIARALPIKKRSPA